MINELFQIDYRWHNTPKYRLWENQTCFFSHTIFSRDTLSEHNVNLDFIGGKKFSILYHFEHHLQYMESNELILFNENDEKNT